MKDKSLILSREKTVQIPGWQKTQRYPVWTSKPKTKEEREYLDKLMKKYKRNGGEVK